MNTFEKFQRLVIEKLHGKPYEEAAGIEWESRSDRHPFNGHLPVTLGMVLVAIENVVGHRSFGISTSGTMYDCVLDGSRVSNNYEFLPDWKMLKDDGFTPADHLDQSEETLQKLIDLLER